MDRKKGRPTVVALTLQNLCVRGVLCQVWWKARGSGTSCSMT